VIKRGRLGNHAQSNGVFDMNAKRASLIFRSLVQGVDPLSGEELPADGVLQCASVLRALLTGIAALDEQQAREARRAKRPPNVGRPWTQDEERTCDRTVAPTSPALSSAQRFGEHVHSWAASAAHE
jgi:hypothetical protein